MISYTSKTTSATFLGAVATCLILAQAPQANGATIRQAMKKKDDYMTNSPTTSPTASPVEKEEEEVPIVELSSQTICIMNNLGSDLALLGIGNNSGETGTVSGLTDVNGDSVNSPNSISNWYWSFYGDQSSGDGKDVIAFKGRQICFKMEGVVNMVFGPMLSSYVDETSLNYVILSQDSKNEQSLRFFQGGYTQEQYEILVQDHTGSLSCDFPSPLPVKASSYLYNTNYCTSTSATMNYFPCYHNSNDLLQWNACEPDDVPAGKFFDYTFIDFEPSSKSFLLKEASFDSFDLGWSLVGVGGSLDTSFTQSWSKTSSSSKTNSNSFTFGISSKTTVGFKALGFSASESITVSASAKQTTSNTLSTSFKTAETVSTTCKSPSCNGRLYQWAIEGTRGNTKESVKDCYFVCVSSHFVEPPKCPLGYCGNKSCQCCNAQWWDGTNTALEPLLLSNGCGKETCTASEQPCKQDSDCCTNRCNIGAVYQTCA